MIVKKQIKIKVELYNFADRGYMHNSLLNISTVSISPNRTNWPNNKIKRGNLHFNKQLLDEVGHDIMNYRNRGLCYLPQPSASADNTDTRF